MPSFDDIAARFPGAGTLVKGIQILELLAGAPHPTSSGELLRATALPKATLYRLLGALVEFGYVHHDPRLRTYTVGRRFIELGRRSLSALDLRTAAEYELTRLARELDETVSLVVLDDDAVLYVDVRRPANPLAIGVEVGRRLPAVQTAAGEAILSAMPPHEVSRFLADHAPEAQARMLADIAISRARGYTIAPSRNLPGVLIVAVPLQGAPGMGWGAIVVAARDDRVAHQRRHVVGRDLMEAARRVMGSIGTATVSISANPRRTPHVSKGLDCVARAGAIVGEGPVWDARRGLIRWVDVVAPAFHAFDPVSGETATTPAPRLVSTVLPAAGGRLIAVTQNGLEALDPLTGGLTPIHDPEAHLPANRFNDAKTDRRGRVWAGSMSLDASMPSGSLYCFDTVTSARAVDGGFLVSNGLGWSPDDRIFYFADSALGTVFAYDFDLGAGTVANRRPFLQFKPAEGRPDGLAVDADGFVWVALWDGWRVARYAPDGTLDREVDMPVPRPSSCAFGGPGLRTLYITTASIRLPAQVLAEAPLSGGLFSIAAEVAGQPVTEVGL